MCMQYVMCMHHSVTSVRHRSRSTHNWLFTELSTRALFPFSKYTLPQTELSMREFLCMCLRCQNEGCQSAFRTPSELKRHQKTHEGQTPHLTSSTYAVCIAELLNHEKLTPRDADKHNTAIIYLFSVIFTPMLMCLYTHPGYRCPLEECGEVFAKWTELRRHTATHPKGDYFQKVLN